MNDMIKKWTNRIIGILFLACGLLMVITDNYSEAHIVILSVFSAAYWWNDN